MADITITMEDDGRHGRNGAIDAPLAKATIDEFDLRELSFRKDFLQDSLSLHT
jgi:hypothetical protein